MKRLGYLGQPGSFSYEAAVEAGSFYKQKMELVGFNSICDVLQALLAKEINYAVVPVENTFGGDVNETMDFFISSNYHRQHRQVLKITRELFLPINQMLIVKPGTEISDIKEIISHPQAITQCSTFLKGLNVSITEDVSTVNAVKKVVNNSDNTIAAIGSKLAAEIFGLEILKSNINNSQHNLTRFIFLGGRSIKPTGDDKTTILFTLKHEKGTLARFANSLATNGINMDKISSHPAKTKYGDYIFLGELEGHYGCEPLKSAIKAINNESSHVWVIGSYPRADHIPDKLNNLNVLPNGIIEIISPIDLKNKFPVSAAIEANVLAGREEIENILSGRSSKKLAIIGPCSIHNTDEAIEYAIQLAKLKKSLNNLFIVMRCYLEKPRTIHGWKGLIFEPNPNNGFNIDAGLQISRQLLLRINELGIPIATEFVESITPQYIADLISYAAIGARTVESPIHRQLASGLSMPVGLKNDRCGDAKNAINAIVAASAPNIFLGINNRGRSSVVKTTGNKFSHLVLRGGNDGPNCDVQSIDKAIKLLNDCESSKMTKIIIDCSHDNSGKDPVKQIINCRNVIKQVVAGQNRIAGFMIESNLEPGNQLISKNLKYGVSITDSCLGWDQTEQLLLNVNQLLNQRL